MKSKGGRAKKASYQTVVMRIPVQIVSEVQRLMVDFYQSIPEPDELKPVTSIQVANDEKPVTSIITLA